MAESAGPIIVTAELAPADQAWAEALRRAHFPAARNLVPAHISLLHHLPPARAAELRGLLAALVAGPGPQARLAGLRSLGRGVAIDVESPGLLAIRAEIAARFEADLVPQDRHGPRLHVTIQNKVAPDVAARTLAGLRAGFAPRASTIAALACWHYRGGPWHALARYPFRGSGRST
jgi:hypothetical protein